MVGRALTRPQALPLRRTAFRSGSAQPNLLAPAARSTRRSSLRNYARTSPKARWRRLVISKNQLEPRRACPRARIKEAGKSHDKAVEIGRGRAVHPVPNRAGRPGLGSDGPISGGPTALGNVGLN